MSPTLPESRIGFRRLAAGAALLAAAAGLWLFDHHITRPARIDAAACGDNMIRVSDALLLFERRAGRLPARLQELVPEFVSEPMIFCRECWKDAETPVLEPRLLYAFDPARRLLADPEGHEVRGLWKRRIPPRSRAIPAQTDLAAPADRPPPQVSDGIVIEAEEFSFVDYGWEIRDDPAAGGGRVLFNKENTTDNSAQVRGFGDFFNVGNNEAPSMLTYRFRVPSAGRYVLQTRMQTGSTHCSNVLHVFVDDEAAGTFGGNDIAPFNWVWSRPVPVRLAAGEHELRIYIWEDGVALDQILVSRNAVAGNAVLQANATGLPASNRTVFVLHAVDTTVLDASRAPAAAVWLRHTGDTPAWTRLRTTIDLPDGPRELLARDFDMRTAGPIVRFPLDLSGIDAAALPRREYLMTTTVTCNGSPAASITMPLRRPFQWRILGMLPFRYPRLYEIADGWTDEDPTELEGVQYRWKSFEYRWFDPHGVLDFGLMFANNPDYAPSYRTLFAQSRFRVAADGTYLLKLSNDDQMTLWIDRKVVVQKDEIKPITRAAQLIPMHLSQGEHTIQYWLSQIDGRWQAVTMFRTLQDGLTPDIEGVDWLADDAAPPSPEGGPRPPGRGDPGKDSPEHARARRSRITGDIMDNRSGAPRTGATVAAGVPAP